MHWFDRLSRQIAEAPEAPASRRTVFKGLGVAAVGAPFASHAAAYANNVIKANTASDDCLACLNQALSDYRNRLLGCYVNYGGVGVAAAVKKKKKKKKKTPARSAGELACIAVAREKLINKANQCRTSSRCSQSAPPTQTGGSGGSVCPPGTGPCPARGGGPAGLCCYGQDACCPCAAAGGYICCAAVIGCNCC